MEQLNTILIIIVTLVSEMRTFFLYKNKILTKLITISSIMEDMRNRSVMVTKIYITLAHSQN